MLRCTVTKRLLLKDPDILTAAKSTGVAYVRVFLEGTRYASFVGCSEAEYDGRKHWTRVRITDEGMALTLPSRLRFIIGTSVKLVSGKHPSEGGEIFGFAPLQLHLGELRYSSDPYFTDSGCLVIPTNYFEMTGVDLNSVSKVTYVNNTAETISDGCVFVDMYGGWRFGDYESSLRPYRGSSYRTRRNAFIISEMYKCGFYPNEFVYVGVAKGPGVARIVFERKIDDEL